MRNFAVIPAAGELKDFWKPVPLLSLGKRTVIFRLLQQLRKRQIYPIVAVGSPGEYGWLRPHVEEFEKIPMWKEIVTSPFGDKNAHLKTIGFLLDYLVQNEGGMGAEAESKVFVIPGDWIFTDGLLAETLTYPAPSLFSHIHDDWSVVLNFSLIPKFLDLSAKYETLEFLVQDQEQLESLGFSSRLGSQENAPGRFCEIDFLPNYELAIQMVAKEW